MAITTQGFRLSTLPQYTPVDPSLVAFNPSQATRGIGDVFQLQNLLQQIKAKKALEDELGATRSARIKAQNSTNAASAAQADSSLKVFEPKSNLDLATIKAQLPLVSKRADVEGLGLDAQGKIIPKSTELTLANINSDLANVGAIGEAKNAQAKLAVAKSESEGRTLPSEEKAKVAGYGNLLAGYEDAAKVRDDKLKVLQGELKDKLDNAKSDNERKRLFEDAKIDEAKANSEFLRAHGRQLLSQVDADKNPGQSVASLELAAKRLEDEYQIPKYVADTYNADGTLKTHWVTPNAQKDKTKELVRDQIKEYRDTSMAIVQKWAKKLGSDAGVAPTQAPQANDSGMTKEDRDAISWFNNSDNKSNPNYLKVRDKLKARGFIK